MMTSAARAPLAYAARHIGRPANDNEGLMIDLFAGGGGASEAAFMVTGRHPDIAVNHDEEAIDLHTTNHRTTLHLQDDIRRIDIPAVLARFNNRWVDLLWASPDCKDHSKAKGGKPKDKNIRGLAWEVMRWAAAIKRATGRLPTVIALENVEEFQDWGPVHQGGPRAGKVMKARRGETFKLWVEQLRSMGFNVDWREIIAADYGAPTTRKRLFLIARSDGLPIVWGTPTHAKRGSTSTLPVWRSAASIINWNLPCPSIFGRKKDLAPKTHRRIAKGIRRYVIESAKPFIIPVTHSTAGDRAYDPLDPLRTATTSKGGDFQVIDAGMMPLTHHGDDRTYDTADPTRAITGANRGEMAQAGVIVGTAHGDHAQRPGLRAWSAEDPTRVQTASNDQAVLGATLVPRYGEREGQEPRARDVEDSLATVTPSSTQGDLAAVVMQKMSENGVGYMPDTPLHTAMAGAPRHATTMAFLGRQFGTSESGRSMEEPHPTVMTDGGGGKSQVAAVHVQRQFGRSTGTDATDPLGAGTGIVKDAQVTAFMAQANGERVGRDVEEPTTTQTLRGTQQQVIAPTIDKYYGNTAPADVVDPADTVTAKDRMSIIAPFMEQANGGGVIGHEMPKPVSTIIGAGSTQRLVEAQLDEIGAFAGSKRRAVLEFLWEHFGEPTAEEWADPAATLQGRLRFGLVILEGVVWQIVDIGMRMLTPRELYRAQGFTDDYEIEITWEGKALTKTAQTRMAGNSVSPPPAAYAVLRPNLPKRMLMAEAA